MDGTVLRNLLQEILPPDLITSLAQELGVISRERKRDIVLQVASLVLSNGSDDSGRLADAYRRYVAEAEQPVVRGAFYAWLDDAMVKLLEALLRHAMTIANAEPVLLPSVCRGASDWVIVDSEVITLRDALAESYAGTGSASAIKVHKDLSLGRGVMSAYHFSAGSEHDSPHLVVDDTYRGKGLLIDLGYVSLDFIRRCAKFEAQYVMRLKSNWQPRITRWHAGELAGELFDGMNFQFARDLGVIVLDGEPIDAEVVLGQGSRKVTARLVGIQGPDGYLFYLTSLARAVATPAEVAELYRVRWEIESDNKLDKTGSRLDQVRATTDSSLKILMLSALLHSVLVDLMVHRDRLRRTSEPVLTTAPLHRLLVAFALHKQHAKLVEALVYGAPQRQWDKCAAAIEVSGRDPNWRGRPSVLDRLVGLCAPPGRPRKAKQADCPTTARPFRQRPNMQRKRAA